MYICVAFERAVYLGTCLLEILENNFETHIDKSILPDDEHNVKQQDRHPLGEYSQCKLQYKCIF
jgi:hypothetical protein